MRPRLEVGMPEDDAKSGPRGMTMTKSRMVTDCTAAASSATARSRVSIFTGPCDAEAGGAGSNLETPDERQVIGLSEERTRLVAEPAGAVQIDPAHRRAAEEMVEVHAQVHEAGGGEAAGRAVGLAEQPLPAEQASVLGDEAVDRRSGRGVEVSADDERVAAGMAVDEGDQRPGFVELVDAEAHLGLAGPELARERRGKREVRVEDVEGAPPWPGQLHMRADAGLLAVLPAQHVMVGDVVRALAVVGIDLDAEAMHEDGQPRGLQRAAGDAVDVGAEVERVVGEGRLSLLPPLLQLGHEHLELRLALVRAAEDEAAAQRDGLHLLQPDDVGGGVERSERLGHARLVPSAAGH